MILSFIISFTSQANVPATIGTDGGGKNLCDRSYVIMCFTDCEFVPVHHQQKCFTEYLRSQNVPGSEFTTCIPLKGPYCQGYSFIVLCICCLKIYFCVGDIQILPLQSHQGSSR